MLSDSSRINFSQEVLNGLIAEIGMTAYCVLSVIAAAQSQEDGPVRISLEKIAELMDKSVESIRSALDVLKKKGLVAIKLQGRNNVYSVAATGFDASRDPG